MKKTTQKTDYSVRFTYAILLCSMLQAFPFRIGGMEATAVILFFLCMVWMTADILQINRGKRKPRSNYRRLDMAAVILLGYEVGLIAVSLMREIGEDEPEPDYSRHLMAIGLVLLYLLLMEAGEFRSGYLDMVLYGGLAVMAALLLGYLFDPQIGACLRLWEDCAATASYLIMVGIVGALQYCRCEDKARRVFYAMCTGLAFFLLACNHSVISFWIVVCALLSVPTLLRPTARLCKSAMQMLFLFLLIISSMGLLANKTGLFLTTVNYDAEHLVCLDMAAAAGGLLFFYCWYRKPEGTPQNKIVMRGFYKLDKLALRGMGIVFALFVSGGAVWQTLDDDRFGLRGARGFAAPLAEEVKQNRSLLFLCLQEQGVTAAALRIVLLLLLMERIGRRLGWKRQMRGLLCVVAVSLLPQILLWEIAPNILPVAVILVSGIIGGGERQERTAEEKIQRNEAKRSGKKVGRKNGGRKKSGAKTGKRKAMLAAGIMMSFLAAFPVQANDTTPQGETQESETTVKCSRIAAAVGELDAHETPDEDAAVVVSYHDGDNIYVTGETADGWYRVRYQDLTGYVRAEQVTEIELDVTALDEEFAVEEAEGKLVVEEVERQRTEVRRSRIWGAAIIFLVLGVFVTGIISTVKNGGKEGMQE